MRTLAILMLLAVFALAVILPNEIGTDGLPAISSKQVAKLRAKAADSPAKAIACIAAVEIQAEAPSVFCESQARRAGTAGNVRLNRPLLI